MKTIAIVLLVVAAYSFGYWVSATFSLTPSPDDFMDGFKYGYLIGIVEQGDEFPAKVRAGEELIVRGFVSDTNGSIINARVFRAPRPESRP